MESDPLVANLTSRVEALETDLGSRVATLERAVAALGQTVALPTAAPPQPEPTVPQPAVPIPGAPIPAVPIPGAPIPTAPITTAPIPTGSGRGGLLPPPPRAEDAVAVGRARPHTAPPRRRPPGPRFEVGVEVLLRWVGIGLVVLAAVFLVSTAIDRGWIGPELQLLGATLIGLGLLAGAFRLIDDQRAWAVALGAGGSVVTVVCAGAAYGWLELWGPVTGLGAVAVAATVSVLAAMRLRLESVAITATAAMLVVPGWARIVADAPVPATGIWLGLFAVVATAVGLERNWVVYRTASVWAAAIWVVGLAALLDADGNRDHMLPGTALVAVVAGALWLGPAVSRRNLSGRNLSRRNRSREEPSREPEASPGDQRAESDGGWLAEAFGLRTAADRAGVLAAIDHRSVIAIPIWAWYSILLFGNYDFDLPGGPLGLALAGGFLAAALLLLERLIGHRSDTLLLSHLLGAGVLITAAAVAWTGGSILVVALAAQGLATVLVGQRLKDGLLQLNGYLLGASAGLLLVDGLVDVIDRSSLRLGESVAQATGVALLWGIGWLAGRDRPRAQVELLSAAVWSVTMLLVASFAAPLADDRGWLVVAVALAAASLIAARELGLWVGVIGALTALAAVTGGAVSILVAGIDGADIGSHLINLTVVVGLIVGTAWAWIAEGRSDVGRPLLVVAWFLALGWLASVFVSELPGSQQQVAISVAWAIAACGAIVVAVRSDETVVRWLGLGTLGVVLVKLLTLDLAEVDTLWRVGLFLVIGLGLLRLGYILPSLAERFRRTAGDGGPERPVPPVPGADPGGHR